MLIADLLRPSNVLFRLRAPDKARLLDAMVEHVWRSFGIERATLLQTLRRREALGSTGMGGGIALPHARLPGVETPQALLARLTPPVDFDAVDARPVDLVMLLLLPAASTNAALNAMACAARCLNNPAITAAMRDASGSDELYAIACGRGG